MKKNLLLLFGGKSVEHEISIRSAKNVAKHINQDKYQLHLIGLSKKGDWYYLTSIEEEITEGIPLSFQMTTPPQMNAGERSYPIDLAFPLLHGTDGEDGGVQGLFKVLDVPVVGSDVKGSAVAMDKITSKMLWAQAGLPVADYLTFDSKTLRLEDYEGIVNKLGLPFMLKAGNLGSSVGISKISNKEQFAEEIVKAASFSNLFLVEEYITGRELECAVLGNHPVETTVAGEIILQKDYDFYTYEAKYEDEHAIKIQVPADVPDEVMADIRNQCRLAFEVSGCKDYGRVDLFLTNNNKVILNEINTIPGFTNVSMFPMLWANMGVDYSSLIQRIIDEALKRHQEVSHLSTSIRG